MVAIKAAAVDRFVQRPDPGITAVLVYGPDRGLVSERTRSLLAKYASNADDPFEVSILDETDIAKSPSLLIDELNAIAFGSPRRTVLVRSGSAPPPSNLADVLAAPRQGVLLVEAGDLKPGSAARKAFEAAKDAAALPCYADSPGTLSGLITSSLGQMQQTINADAMDALRSRLGADRLSSRAEIEKLMLYAGAGAHITIDDVDAATADAGEVTLDALVDAIGEGRAGKAELAHERATQAGMAPAQILSATIRHFLRLHECAVGYESGNSIDRVIGGLRPPVHFKRKDSFARQLRRWPEQTVRQALTHLAEAEIDGRISPVSGASTSRTLLRLMMLPRPVRPRS